MDQMFLPEPRLPITATSAADGIPRGLHPDVDRFAVDAEALTAEVLASFARLEAARPGGSRWRDALAADGDALLAGKLPDETAVEVLLIGDAHRWAVASAEARTLTTRVAELHARIDHGSVVKAMTAMTGELVGQRRPQLHDAYRAVRTGDDLVCRTVLRDVDVLTGRIVDATRLAAWCSEANPAQPFSKVTGLQFPGPQGRSDYGYRFACRLELGERIITLPVAGRDIEWPPGYRLDGAQVGMVLPMFDAEGGVRQPLSVPAVL